MDRGTRKLLYTVREIKMDRTTIKYREFPVKPGEKHCVVLSSLNFHFKRTYSEIQSRNIWVRYWGTSCLCSRAQHLLSSLPTVQIISHTAWTGKWLLSCVIHTKKQVCYSEHMAFLAYEERISSSSIQFGETEINEWVWSQVCKAARFGSFPRANWGKILRAIRGLQQQFKWHSTCLACILQMHFETYNTAATVCKCP